MTAPSPVAPVEVVGIPIDPLTQAQIVELVLGWAESDTPRVGVGINAAVCNLAATRSEFRADLARADLRYADGQSVVWAARLLGGRLPERVATTDLILPLCALAAQRGKRLYLFGAKPGVAARAADMLRGHAPGLLIRSSDGYISPEEMPRLIEDINAFQTDILLVGLGDPLQQRWVATHLDQLTASAILTCGGLFDWISGDNPRAPQWMISGGLEWLWRLMIEPRRLATRYLLGNPAFLARLTRQLVRGRASAL